MADTRVCDSSTVDALLPPLPAVEKLLPLRVGGLFMDMGTGKSRVAIELVARRQRQIDRVIIYCPVSLDEYIEIVAAM